VRVGALLGGDAPAAQAQLRGAAVEWVRGAHDVPGGAHSPDVIEDCRQRHGHELGHLGRGERALLVEKAVHGVLVGPHSRLRERVGQHAAEPLGDDEEVEEEGDVGAP